MRVVISYCRIADRVAPSRAALIGSPHAPLRRPTARSAPVPPPTASPFAGLHEVPHGGRRRRVGAVRPDAVTAWHCRVLDRLPVVRRPRPRERLRVGVRCPAGPGGVVHPVVLRAPVRKPHGRRSTGAPHPSARPGRGHPARLPPAGGPSQGPGPPGALRPVRAHCRAGSVGSLAGVAAVHQRRGLRHHRCTVRPGPGLLRLPPAVHELRDRLAVRHPDNRPGTHHDLPLHKRWNPTPVGRRACAAAGQGPPFGPTRPHRPRAGRGLLAGTIRADHLGPGCRGRSHLHRRECAAPGDEPPDPHLPVRRRAAAGEHQAAGLGAAHAGRRAVGVRGAGNGRHLPGGHPEPASGAGGVREGGAVHSPEHRSHPDGVRPRRDHRGAAFRLRQQDRRIRPSVEQGDGPQHSDPGPADRAGHLRPAAGRARVLHLHRRDGHRPLHHRR